MKMSPVATFALLVVARTASADPVAPDVVVNEDTTKHAIDRTWLYADDARIPAPLTVIATSNVSYTSVGSSPSRVASPYPSSWYNGFGGNVAQAGGMIAAGAELGLFPHVSVIALGQMGFGGAEGTSNPDAGVISGLRVQLTPLAWERFHVVASAGYMRVASVGPVYDGDADTWHAPVPGGANGAWGQIAVAGDFARLRMAGTVHCEHVFSPGRDPVDVMVTLGASYRVVSTFRLGVEYVGQDLEETFSAEAEDGPRHFVGPIASLQLADDRLSIVAGPSVGLSDLSPQVLGRVAVSYGF